MAKTVGVRLRTIHSDDYDLLNSLNLYSGYILARGYNEKSVKFHLAAMANRDRDNLLIGKYKQKSTLKVPLVVDLHPAITCLSPIMSETISKTCEFDPLLNILIPSSSLIVAYRKLPNLMKLLCSPNQNKFINNETNHNIPQGYIDTGCLCLVCKASNFGKFISPPSLPGYKIPICGPLYCSTSPALVYHLQCNSGKKECANAHYVGSASTSNPKIKPMALRWSNHKSHHKHTRNQCTMTEHLITFHKNENAQDLIKITLLEACDPQILKLVETKWCYKLFSFTPSGLNVREEANISN